jgi:hypothetical protein
VPPLLLAGVRPLQALYRAVSTYPHLLEDGIGGNPELISAGELHRQVWAIAEPELRRGASAAVRRYRELRGTGRTLSDPEEARRAAAHGGGSAVFVVPDAGPPGPSPTAAILRY